MELQLSLEELVFLLLAAGKFASSMVIRDILLDQPEELLARWKMRLISMRISVEHLIYTVLNNQNLSLCGQKLIELIKNSRYICKF